MNILVINGPNLNMLGIREQNLYGEKTYKDLIKYIKEYAAKANVFVKIVQFNHEGKIIDAIQAAYKRFDGIILNAAAYTHTSIAILDALKAVNLPTVEVHLTDIENREEYRKKSFVGEYAFKRVCGMGFEGYGEALSALAELLSMPKNTK